MIAALVLAAGLGSRMGASKPLFDIDGRPSLARVLDAVDGAGVTEVVVVLGRDADRVAAQIDLAARHVVRNPAPERGLSSSLELGLASIPMSCTGALVFHADMPFVRSSTVRAVHALARDGATIAAPRLGDVRGFPVYFSRDCFALLRAELSGDTGGRGFIERHRAALCLVNVTDPGCLRDIDRPEDLVAFKGETPWTTSE
ncbi:MAG: nucleotidyltransferase family protein [Candidatus Bipolaricaulota bacterium]|nr:nucleotidyltransferase family protein [Candidatus Bipolaricaulota bacterium]